MRRLEEAERSRDVTDLVALFTNDAHLESVARTADAPDSNAETFWTQYLDGFREIRSSFLHVTEEGERTVLEWSSEGRLPAGDPIRYRGVSVLEWDDDRVRRFRTYYDSAAFVRTRASVSGATSDEHEEASERR